MWTDQVTHRCLFHIHQLNTVRRWLVDIRGWWSWNEKLSQTHAQFTLIRNMSKDIFTRKFNILITVDKVSLVMWYNKIIIIARVCAELWTSLRNKKQHQLKCGNKSHLYPRPGFIADLTWIRYVVYLGLGNPLCRAIGLPKSGIAVF